jgi:hypothetical protein
VKAAVEPRGWRLVLPDTWLSLDLRPDTRRRSARELAASRVGPGDERAPLRAAVGELVLRTAEGAYDARAQACWLFTDSAGPLPLCASLTAYVTVARDPQPPATAADLAGRGRVGDRPPDVRLAQLPAGVAVRSSTTCTGGRDLDGQPVPSYVVRYDVPLPGDPGVLVLAFATPVVALAEAMGELFEAIASSLQWTPGPTEKGRP